MARVELGVPKTTVQRRIGVVELIHVLCCLPNLCCHCRTASICNGSSKFRQSTRTTTAKLNVVDTRLALSVYVSFTAFIPLKRALFSQKSILRHRPHFQPPQIVAPKEESFVQRVLLTL